MIPEGNLCYLATPFTHYRFGPEAAFVEAAQITAKLVKAGIITYSPIVHGWPLSRYGDIDAFDHSIWLPLNEPMLIACDILIVARMDGWRDSLGVGVEIKHFEDTEKPIFDLDPLTMRMSKRQAVRVTAPNAQQAPTRPEPNLANDKTSHAGTWE